MASGLHTWTRQNTRNASVLPPLTDPSLAKDNLVFLTQNPWGSAHIDRVKGVEKIV
jgi:hypothetical protein